MTNRLPGEEWNNYVERNGASLDPRDRYPIDKEAVAVSAIESFPSLVDVLGLTEASTEMGHALGGFVLAGELNQFEADLIGTVAILSLFVRERLDGTEGTLGE